MLNCFFGLSLCLTKQKASLNYKHCIFGLNIYITKNNSEDQFHEIRKVCASFILSDFNQNWYVDTFQ